MTINDFDSSNDLSASNAQSIVLQNISNQDDTVVESYISMVDNRNSLRNDKQTNESTSGNWIFPT